MSIALASTATEQSRLIRPFLKWPGGKFRLLNTLKSLMPQTNCFVEPFVGAGALFLNNTSNKIIVNDINSDLINLYLQIKSNPNLFVRNTKKIFTPKFNCSDYYYQFREQFNLSKNPKEKAKLFLYLNRHGYNGLCRYNSKGFYNVPFGDYKRPYFPEAEIFAFNAMAEKISFHSQDFTSFLEGFLLHPHLKDYVFYCDPPYAPLNKTSNFTSYAQFQFTDEQQKQLALLAEKLARKGAIVIISNHDTPFTRDIYKKAKIKRLHVRRSISCIGKKRGKASELIAVF